MKDLSTVYKDDNLLKEMKDFRIGSHCQKANPLSKCFRPGGKIWLIDMDIIIVYSNPQVDISPHNHQVSFIEQKIT